MNITAFLFIFIFCICLGNVTGKLFKKMNPFLVMFGLILVAGFLPVIHEQNNVLYFVAFGLGFIENFFSVFGVVRDGFYHIRYRFELNSAAHKVQDNLDRQRAEYEEELKQQKREAEDDLRRQRQNAEDHLRREHEEAEERIRRAKEDLKRQREEAERQKQSKGQQSSSRSQSSGASANEEFSMPRTFAQACEVLGVSQNATLAECKKAKRTLAAMYHPDKFESFTGKRRRQAEIEFQKIMCAWDIVEKELK